MLAMRVDKLGENADVMEKTLESHNAQCQKLEQKLHLQNGRTTRQRADIELVRLEMVSIQERLRMAEEELVECHTKVGLELGLFDTD